MSKYELKITTAALPNGRIDWNTKIRRKSDGRVLITDLPIHKVDTDALCDQLFANIKEFYFKHLSTERVSELQGW